MARPRLAIPRAVIARLYTDEGMSTREIARKLCVSRWIVVARLEELGVELRERDEAAGLARFLRESREEVAEANRCAIPECLNAREFGRGVCTQHWGYLTAERSALCRWPRCNQPAGRDSPTCYTHSKKATGLL